MAHPFIDLCGDVRLVNKTCASAVPSGEPYRLP